MSWTKAVIDSDSVIFSNGIVAFIMKGVPNCPFLIGETPVTQALWMAVEGNNPSEINTNPFFPVDNVSYPSAKAFIKHLNEATGESFRLPTAIEWEMAAKCGDDKYPFKYAGTDDFDSIDTGRCAVKEHEPNEIGLYCLTGNVLEWTETISTVTVNRCGIPNSLRFQCEGATETEERILKGGSSAHGRHTSGIMYGNHYPSYYSNGLTGLRLIIDRQLF